MAHRFILGLIVAASLSGCFDSGSPTIATSGATTAAAEPGTIGTTPGTTGTTPGTTPGTTDTTPGTTPGTTGTTPGTTSSQILLKGVPPNSVMVGGKYSFRPIVSSSNDVVTFAIQGQPSWTTFDTTTGALSGWPATDDVGLSGRITIIASGSANTGRLGPFTIRVNPPGSPTIPGPTISGRPRTSVVMGNAYSFTPTTTDPSDAALTFSVKNAPSWAAFNGATGELSGTPTAGDVGTYSNITISVSDGTASVSLPVFHIAVTQIANGSATLEWLAPTENVDGTALTNLAGYRIYYGTSATAMTQVVKVASPGILTYLISNLSPGTWYFSMRAYTRANVESNLSAVASTTID